MIWIRLFSLWFLPAPLLLVPLLTTTLAFVPVSSNSALLLHSATLESTESSASFLRLAGKKGGSQGSQGSQASQAKGFGKQTKPAPSPKKGGSKKAKPIMVNARQAAAQKAVDSISSPEYDDEGNAYIADEKTGEKKRVLDALVEYPCIFTMKIVGANDGEFAKDMVAVVAENCEVPEDEVDHSVKVNGKWTSVTVQAPVKSAEMLYGLYDKIDADPRVKFKF